MANILLLIVGAILGIALFSLLLKVALEGAKYFLETTFKFLVGVLIIGLIAFSGYVIVKKDSVQKEMDSVFQNTENQDNENLFYNTNY